MSDSAHAFLAKADKRSPIDLRNIPEEDPGVLKMVNSGLTMGCFQLESPLMRSTLQKLKVKRLDDFAAAIAVIRPGVGNTGKRPQYIRRRRGLESTVYMHPSLESILKETFGVPIFQEQVILMACAVAGFTLSQADSLRKVMTKNRKDKVLIDKIEKQFLSGALKNGISVKKSQEIWQYLFEFTGFGFNKAHACTYGIIAYLTAFLKFYFPTEYMVAVLNNPGAFYSTGAYISECRRLGIEILPPDVNYSERLFAIEGKAIRVGLFPIFELSETTQKTIVEQRKRKPFQDLYDFLKRVGPQQREVENLIRCGAMRSIFSSEPTLLMKVLSYFNGGQSKERIEYLTKGFAHPPYFREQRIAAEVEILGFGVLDHPLAIYQEIIPWNEMVGSTELENHQDERIKFTGWYVTNRSHKTKTGELMFFLTLEDTHSFCDVVFFPKMFQRYRHLFRSHGPFTAEGTIQSRMEGEINLIAEKVCKWMSPKEVMQLMLTKQGK